MAERKLWDLNTSHMTYADSKLLETRSILKLGVCVDTVEEGFWVFPPAPTDQASIDALENSALSKELKVLLRFAGKADVFVVYFSGSAPEDKSFTTFDWDAEINPVPTPRVAKVGGLTQLYT